MTRQTRARTDGRLRRELARLQAALQWGFGLTARWTPDPASKVSGKVEGDVIFLYPEGLEEASKTLRHEFCHAFVAEAVKPYVRLINLQRLLINTLLRQLEDEAYEETEVVAEKLRSLLDASTSG